MSTLPKTYASKGGARKAARKAGIASELIEITVDGERFGFKAMEAPVTTPAPEPAKPEPKPKPVRVKQNGVSQPAPGGVCRQVWDWLDANPDATAKQVREASPGMGWNLNNSSAEYYQWRKWSGISGRVKKPDDYRTSTKEERDEDARRIKKGEVEAEIMKRLE